MYNVELSAHLYNSNTISPNKEYNNNRQFTNDTEIYEFASYSPREY